MRRVRWIVVPIILTWFGGMAWWVTHRNTCGCATSPASTAAAAAIAPSSPIDPIPPQASAAVAQASRVPAAPAPIDPLLLQPFIIPFTKNHGATGQPQDLDRFAQAFNAHLLAHP